MKKTLAISVAALALAAVFGPRPLEAQTCDVSYRIWQDGRNTYYGPNDWVPLEVGDRVDLYIHGHRSRSADPYSASAEFGAPTAFGVGGQRPQDIDRVLRLGNQDPAAGKISFTAVAAGQTAIGYRITGVKSPGRVEDIPARCRTGQVRFNVGGSRGIAAPPAPAPPSAPTSSAGEAAHQLIVDLYTGILRRSRSEVGDYPNDWFDRVQASGLQGLIFVAETMTTSTEFRSSALQRTRQALEASGVAVGNLSQRVVEDQLLSDIFRSLYGSNLPGDQIRSLMASKLSSCMTGSTELCRQLGRDLLSQRQYHDNNSRLLQQIRRF